MEMTLKVLIIEDNPDDVLLLVHELRKGGYNPDYKVVENGPSMSEALQEQSWDIILCDFVLPVFGGLEALRVLQQSGLDLPFIIVSGHIGEDTAVDIMKAGVHDVIQKSNLKRLVPAITRELEDAANRRERRKMEESLEWSNAKFQLLSDTANLLLSNKARGTIQAICEKVMVFLDCDIFFNYLMDTEGKRLFLNAFAGISPEIAREIEWLDFAETVCSCADRGACPLVAADIQNQPEDEYIARSRKLGMQAYSCHPILSAGAKIGALAFGSRRKTSFTDEDLEVIRAITSQVAIALDRIRYEEQLETYAKRITRVQEEERKRIARELHDEAAQSMSILSLELDALISRGEMCSEKSLERLQAIKENTDRTMQNIRRYSHELHSSILDHLGLNAALEQLVEETNERDGLVAELEIQGEERKLGQDIELALFRITQQALRNIWQHAGATEVRVTLRYLEDKLKLTVADNGKGFDTEKESRAAVERGSLGLVSMNERAYLIGADLKIESSLNRGTTVSVDLNI